MAIIFGSKFKPFSYEEMLQPVASATNAQQQIEENYNTMSDKTNALDDIVGNNPDSKAYKLYQGYKEDLNAQAQKLIQEGITPSTRQGLMNIRSRYYGEIDPIYKAYNSLLEDSKFRKEQKARDNTIIFQNPNPTIDDYLNNPVPENNYYSGAMIAKQVADNASNLTKRILTDKEYGKSILGGQYYDYIKKFGYSPKVILDYLQKNNNPILNEIVEQAVDNSGIKNWGDENAEKQARNFAQSGIWSAIGEDKSQVLSNKEYDYNLEMRKAKLQNQDNSNVQPQVFYKNIPSVHKGIDNDNYDKELAFIETIKNNPSLLTKPTKVDNDYRQASSDATSVRNNNIPTNKKDYQNSQSSSNNYWDTYQSLKKKYNIQSDNINDLYNAVSVNKSKTLVYNNSYKLNITSDEYLTPNVKANAITLANSSKNGSTGIYDYKNGKKGNEISLSEIDEYLEKDNVSYIYKPKVGIIIVNNKTGKSAIVDNELLTGEYVKNNQNQTVNKYSNYMDMIVHAADNGDIESANKNLYYLFGDMYSQSNNTPKIQSKTNANLQ